MPRSLARDAPARYNGISMLMNPDAIRLTGRRAAPRRQPYRIVGHILFSFVRSRVVRSCCNKLRGDSTWPIRGQETRSVVNILRFESRTDR